MIRVVSLKNDLHFVVFWSLRLGFISGQNRVFDIVRKCILGAGRIMCFNFWCLYPDLWWLNNIKGATQLHLYNAPSKKAQYKKYKKRYKYAYSYICAYTHTHTHKHPPHHTHTPKAWAAVLRSERCFLKVPLGPHTATTRERGLIESAMKVLGLEGGGDRRRWHFRGIRMVLSPSASPTHPPLLQAKRTDGGVIVIVLGW